LLQYLVMPLADLVRRILPARTQDVLRLLVDNVAPARRRAALRAKAAAAAEACFAARVSPDGVVLAGLFEGLRFPPGASWGGMGARLAGTYELELRSVLGRVIASRPSQVVDIGAAEGYYSLGLARALPSATVLSFDIDPLARQLCSAGAALNRLTNVDVRGRIDPRELHRQLEQGAFVLSDCEGYEWELLDPALVPALRSATLLVELHEFCRPGVTSTILSRFSRTHALTLIDSLSRDRAAAAHLPHLTAEEVDRALDEGRPVDPHPMQWAYLEPSPT
jgi:hypothetical protein